MQFTCTNHKERRPPSFTHENHPPKKGNHDIRRETRRTVSCSRYRLSAERFFTLTSHYCSGKRLILKPLNFGGRWQNCQFPHGGKSQLASPHLLSAGRKSYYFVYIKIWNMLHLPHRLLRRCIGAICPERLLTSQKNISSCFMIPIMCHFNSAGCWMVKIVSNVNKHPP